MSSLLRTCEITNSRSSEIIKSNSRFFLGSNKVMQIALGWSESDNIIPDLHNNRLNGIVSPLVNCTKLKFLYLAGNDLSGKIPSEISSLRRLLRLDLADNNLRAVLTEPIASLFLSQVNKVSFPLEHYEDLVHDVLEVDFGRVNLPSYADKSMVSWEDTARQVTFGSNCELESSKNRKDYGNITSIFNQQLQRRKSKKDFTAQTGDLTGMGSGGYSTYKFLYGDQVRFFNDEIHLNVKHSKIGTVAMASVGENLNASQFLCLGKKGCRRGRMADQLCTSSSLLVGGWAKRGSCK
ncbi:hypothetical protein ACFX13_031418 [Malus domestica]